MELARRCFQDFDRRDWSRGKEYFKNGAVDIHKRSTTYLEAAVQGSERRPYQVRIDWSQARQQILLVYCTCPRFADAGLCKHVAATILAADDRGFGSIVPGRSPLFLEPDDEASDLRYGDDDGDDTDWEHDAEIRVPRGGGLARGRASRAGGEQAKVLSMQRRGDDKRRKKLPSTPGWKKSLALLNSLQTTELESELNGHLRVPEKPRQIWYLLDLERTRESGLPCVTLRERPIKKDGTPGKLKVAKFSKEQVLGLPSADDRTLLGLLAGNERDQGFGYSYGDFSGYQQFSGFTITSPMIEILLPRLCASGRFGWLLGDEEAGDDQIRPLAWDDGPAWKLRLDVSKTSDLKHWQLGGRLQRDQAVRELSAPLMLLACGLAIFPDCLSRFEAGDEFPWTVMLSQSGPILVPVKHEEELVEQLALSPQLPQADLPKKLRWEESRPAPIPQLKISRPKESWHGNLECHVTFRYGDSSASLGGGPTAWFDRPTRRVVRRDRAAELALRDQLLEAGAQRPAYYTAGNRDLLCVSSAKMPKLVVQLTAAGWQVEAEGRLIRRPGQLTISVTSGVDWFDLEAACDFEGVSASLPKLLAALQQGEQYVLLDDGSQGMLPADWLARYAPLAELGQAAGDRVRFVPTQAALLDALLAAQDSSSVSVDKSFAQLRDRLRSFDGILPRQEPKSFVGELRPYQREGLGWLHFLDEFGFGGCLADDMGLGKTVQIWRFLTNVASGAQPLAARAPKRGVEHSSAPSLVVVPRSLIFNWMEEARRFAPKLRVLDFTGLDRASAFDRLDEYDLVLTTYGTLRRDIAKLREIEFDYAILDESQAIKNASSQAAKACRLLRARRRLAMTGTPVENHLAELWSLFEFLNPGMLGRSPNLNQLFAAGRNVRGGQGESEKDSVPAENVAILARALRPFLLRRTKQQVLTELPAKTEQTLFCELDARERKLYEELREHYRRTLLERVRKVGVNKSKIHVLEALLRLRQAACHPGLLDKERTRDGSSKLETLLEQLAEVVDEGHKALVFSQFTSLLAIVRGLLDQRRIEYEYLDGRTIKRQSKVERFQTDPNCRLFLISLKAGGQGLNLTAADYVFILDPWWNPAVEAQAVDRAHRIGQIRQVFAYRLIARDTVEEKILQLQARKRDLAEAIVSADNSLLRSLTSEDLQLLLS